MKKRSAFLMSLLFCLLSFHLHAAEKDAADCKDHPLLPRMPGYYILGCADSDANFDMEAAPGKPAATTHIEGKSTAILYSAQPELKAKPSRQQILGNFEKGIKRYGGTLVGMANTAPVYKLADGGREVLVIVLADKRRRRTRLPYHRKGRPGPDEKGRVAARRPQLQEIRIRVIHPYPRLPDLRLW